MRPWCIAARARAIHSAANPDRLEHQSVHEMHALLLAADGYAEMLRHRLTRVLHRRRTEYRVEDHPHGIGKSRRRVGHLGQQAAAPRRPSARAASAAGRVSATDGRHRRSAAANRSAPAACRRWTWRRRPDLPRRRDAALPVRARAEYSALLARRGRGTRRQNAAGNAPCPGAEAKNGGTSASAALAACQLRRRRVKHRDHVRWQHAKREAQHRENRHGCKRPRGGFAHRAVPHRAGAFPKSSSRTPSRSRSRPTPP